MIDKEESPLLLVGEIIVDYTLPRPGQECKLRLGGIAHAARGLWASGIRYAVAAICPKYLVNSAKNYLKCHGCADFIWLGEVNGSPNVIIIGDPTEVSDQGYEDLLREEKEVTLLPVGDKLKPYSNIVIFPGKFHLPELRKLFSEKIKCHVDIAYDIKNLSDLFPYIGSINSIIISTSSELFLNYGHNDINALIDFINPLGANVFLLKENRGGSRLFDLKNGTTEEIYATLTETVNSVGVGDVYSAVFAGLIDHGHTEAVWRGASAATRYAQTTYPDDLKRDITRDLKLSVDTIRGLGGTFLPWHDRRRYSIYLAAPDFSYIEKPELDGAINALEYHNFHVRRPILENGQLPPDSNLSTLASTYCMDVSLLDQCDIVFAVPLAKDPGTLFEIGMAVQMGKPVVTFDPRNENKNTMIMAGSTAYSNNLDHCINSIFQSLSNIRRLSA